MSNNFAVTTLLSAILSKIFNFDSTTNMIISTGLGNFISSYGTEFSLEKCKDFINFKNGIIICIIMLAYYTFIHIKSIISYFKPKDCDATKYTELIMYNDTDIRDFLAYVEYYQEYYEKPQIMEFGDPTLLTLNISSNPADITNRSCYKKAGDDTKVKFVDKNFKVEGYYVWKKKQVAIEKDKSTMQNVNLPYIIVCVKNDKETKEHFNINQYFTNIKNKLASDTSSHIKLLHAKMIKQKEQTYINEYVTYDGNRKDLKYLEELYIKSFFHKSRDKVWNYIKKIEFEPHLITKLGQAPRIGLLLYGPPGTGKSSFAYRIAMALNRHIVSIDLSSIDCKNTLYQMIRKPVINRLTVEPKKVVYIFDEFDIGVRKLYSRSVNRLNTYSKWLRRMDVIDKKKIIEEYYESDSDKSDSYDDESDRSDRSEDEDDDEDDEDENESPAQVSNKILKERTPRTISGSSSGGLKELLNNITSSIDVGKKKIGFKSDDVAQQIKTKKKKRNRNRNRNKNKYYNDENKYANYVNESYMNSMYDITLEDLLEIFQGPVPLDGSIIIATTNKYEEISKLCPALFRPGRLTPIHFNNLEKDILNEMTKYFFAKDFPNDIELSNNIPPSHVIEILSEVKLCESDDMSYDKFVSSIREINEFYKQK